MLVAGFYPHGFAGFENEPFLAQLESQAAFANRKYFIERAVSMQFVVTVGRQFEEHCGVFAVRFGGCFEKSDPVFYDRVFNAAGLQGFHDT